MASKMKKKRASATNPAPATALARVIDNAFYFLGSALRDLKKDRQRSVIDFYTAVELFLKARLLQEHWTLIVAKDPEHGKFARGDFVSISFDEACNRIKNVLGQGISEDARRAFNTVRLHRNKMVHFFHNGDIGSARGDIALEQLRAWCHLSRLVTGEWAAAFPEHVTRKMEIIERSLVDHRGYARERYIQIKPILDKEAKGKNGPTFVKCPACTMAAAQITNANPWLRDYKCRVCFNTWSDMDIVCPQCKKLGVLKAYEAFTCKKKGCGHTVAIGDLYYLLDDEPITKDNYFEAVTPGNCDECQGFHTVCSHKGTYLCTNCLSAFEHLYACEWCGEHGSQNREHSEWTGCEHCEGKSGYIRDE